MFSAWSEAVRQCSYCSATSESRAIRRVSFEPDRWVCPSEYCQLAFLGEQAFERLRGRIAASRMLRRGPLALNDEYDYALKMLHRIAYSEGGSFELVGTLRRIALDTLTALCPPSEADEGSRT